MEQLIRELHDQGNQANPEKINQIQKQIQHIQRERSSWQLGLDFLQNEDSLIRFYGALTLTIKINADWDNDLVGENQEMRNHFLNALISSYVRLNTLPDANFVLLKLSSTLAAYFQKLNSRWVCPLSHTLACLLQRQFIPQGQVPTIDNLLEAASRATPLQLIGVVRLAATMVEDMSSRSLRSSEANHLTDQMIDNTNDAWQIFRFILARYTERNLHPGIESIKRRSTSHSQWSEEDHFAIVKLVLQAMPGWTSFLKPKASSANKIEIDLANQAAKSCVIAVMNCISDDRLAGFALQTITTFLTVSPRLLTKADPQFPRNITTSRKAEEWVSSLMSGNFDPEAILYVDFLEAAMSQVDTTSPDYAKSGHYQQVLFTLPRLLRCEGVAVIEDTACQIALEAVSQIVEGYTDWGDSNDNDQNFMKTFIEDACIACLAKIKIPEEELHSHTQTWESDERAKFQDFRYDVHDFLQSAFVTLGTGLIQEIAKSILGTNTEPDWSSFEASLFSLTAFSDTISNEPAIYDELIMAIFHNRQWHEVMQSTHEIPDRTRQTCIKFISENTGYLQRHTTDLVPILNFLFSSLHLPTSAGVASRAIYTLCDTQRAVLVDALPQFLSSLTSISDLSDTEQHRIYGGVASIVQALPTEEAKIQPLSQILDMVTQTAKNCLTGLPQNEEGLAQAIHVLQTLAAIGRGLRVSADTPIDLDSSNHKDDHFWTDGHGSMLQHQTLTLYSNILQHFRPNSAFVEASCDFIRSGFTEDHPSPFKFSISLSLNLVHHEISVDSPNIDAVMSCASSFLASVSPDKLREGLMALFQPVGDGCQKLVSEFKRSGNMTGDNFPSAILEFMARLMSRWGSSWFAMHNGQYLADIIIELASIVITDSDTLPRRAAASFFAALVDISGPSNSIDEPAQTNLTQILQRHSPHIIGQILWLLGGECARSELESMTDPLRRFVHRQPMLTKSISKELMKEESGILSEKALKSTSLEQRLRFLAQIEGLRGARKTNDVVKDFLDRMQR